MGLIVIPRDREKSRRKKRKSLEKKKIKSWEAKREE